MCYGMGCPYEDYRGKCSKPGFESCPMAEDYDGPYEPDIDFEYKRQACEEAKLHFEEKHRREREREEASN